jgi:hypothetical protein
MPIKMQNNNQFLFMQNFPPKRVLSCHHSTPFNKNNLFSLINVADQYGRFNNYETSGLNNTFILKVSVILLLEL